MRTSARPVLKVATATPENSGARRIKALILWITLGAGLAAAPDNPRRNPSPAAAAVTLPTGPALVAVGGAHATSWCSPWRSPTPGQTLCAGKVTPTVRRVRGANRCKMGGRERAARRQTADGRLPRGRRQTAWRAHSMAAAPPCRDGGGGAPVCRCARGRQGPACRPGDRSRESRSGCAQVTGEVDDVSRG